MPASGNARPAPLWADPALFPIFFRITLETSGGRFCRLPRLYSSTFVSMTSWVSGRRLRRLRGIRRSSSTKQWLV